MANFIDRLSARVEEKRHELSHTLRHDANSDEASLFELVSKNWQTLLPSATGERRPAFGVDGSRAVRHLANGAYLFVAQALVIGEHDGSRDEEIDVDVAILPGATDSTLIERSAGFLMHRFEVGLARKLTERIPRGSIIFLDGALYGQLTSLYEWSASAVTGLPDNILEMPKEILDHYLRLFEACVEHDLILISIAKTSHEVAHGQVWWRHAYGEEMPKDKQISDSEAIYRWTNRRAGYSTPVLFGKSSFFRGTRRNLQDSLSNQVQDAPAIVSFFVRLADFDDALRIDVPASCLGRAERIGTVEQEQLLDVSVVQPILELLMADYGGLEVYNSLLYSVDREVRLRQDVMDQVYHSLIQDMLGIEMPLDRSERRFHA
jgi:hypothetical protein